MQDNHTIKPNGWALIPLLIFVSVFLGTGVLLNDFYALPAPIAVLVGLFAAFIALKGGTQQKIATFLQGCGESRIMTMCIIFLLAGAFATVTKTMGGVDAVVQLGMQFISVKYLPIGIFIITAFLSLATGTSVGAIVAMGPIVVGLADQSGVSLALLCGMLLSGAMFGDNLSIISDTTIAATQSFGVKMGEKFKVNTLIALPAFLITIILLLFFLPDAQMATQVSPETPVSVVKIIPYLLVVGLAVSGINVFYTLFTGIIAAGVIGLAYGDFGLLTFAQEIYQGFTGMINIFLLAMLTGGLAAMVRKAGGIAFVMQMVSQQIRSKKSAQTGMGFLTGLTNTAIANNTVSIIITGTIAKNINDSYQLDPRKSATILDNFVCVVQGILPYGAQMLLILNFSQGNTDYISVLEHAWYLFALLGMTLISIYTPLWDKLIAKIK